MDDINIAARQHPLSPLSAAEIVTAAEIVKNNLEQGADLYFEMIELAEPEKSSVANHEPGGNLSRQAWVNSYSKTQDGVTRSRVSLNSETLLSSNYLPDAHPMIAPEEFGEIEEALKADPRFIAACDRRGIEDISLVTADAWSAGNFGVENEKGRRVSHVFCWVRNEKLDNHYAHPLEGLNATIDIRTREVIDVFDNGEVPIPRIEANYDQTYQATVREDLRPINVEQPEGVSFSMTGDQLSWHDWKLIIGFNAREGLTLHQLSIADRPVLYRASIAEMMVPYGSPEGAHPRKNVFDVGEYGVGRLVNSLELGCDCLGAIQYLDAVLNDREGQTVTLKNAICIHEEDTGILWKHYDFRTARTETRRARRLVISSITTVGNYEYGYYWYLYLDGTIEFEIKATGIINTTACLPGQPGPYGVEVSPGVLGQIHQHVFCARLDMTIDGTMNSVVECNTAAEPMGPDNPYGNAYRQTETVLTSEKNAARRADQMSQRFWKFTSAERKNHVGTPTAYKLMPMSTITPFISPDGPSGKRAGYIYNDLWVTAFDPEERFPAGEFVNGCDGSDGLPKFIEGDRGLVDQDLVAWHVFGLHHMPRAEDFPVQPCISCGFKLMPVGFFDNSNALDLPWEKNAASCHAKSSG
jgi:primary-amine oxidase